jgi:hypothetical protein
MTDLSITLPLSAKRADYAPVKAAAHYAAHSELRKNRYHYEKMLGRRKHNGADKLKGLRPSHKMIVAAHINGMRGVEIAEQLNISAITVYRVLGDPLVAPLIQEFDDGFKADFRAMFPLVADAVRTGLEDSSPTTRLKAADRWAKICRVIDGDGAADDSRVETIYAARMKFVQLIQDAVQSARGGDTALVIEAEVVERASTGA